MEQTIGSPILWAGFTLAILFLLALDLGVLNRRSKTPTPREALGWVLLWVTLALGFAIWVAARFGPTKGMEFVAGYLVEYSLSVDNIFVFLVIFSYFSVPPAFQHRVLFWGILGAILLRGIFILAGAALLHRFHWLIYLFGVALIAAGIKLLRQRHEEVHPERNPVLRLFRRFVPMVPDYHGTRFIVRLGGRWFATPMLLVLAVVEATDVIFAIDSIPAVFGVSHDPFIVFTSNIFAILGLRSLYFLLRDIMDRFSYLKVGLGLVLSFVGVKMLLSDTAYKIPISVSLAVICTLLAGSILVSLLKPAAAPPLPEHVHGEDHHAPPFVDEEEAASAVAGEER